MLKVVTHGPVRELVMASVFGRLLGYKVSAFVHRGILVDTGPVRCRRALTRYLDAHPVKGALVTHWHEDHAGNLAELVRRGTPVTASPETLSLLPRAERLARYRQLTWGEVLPIQGAPAPAEHPFELLPTPGHSPDHVAVWDPESRVVFLGDLFLGIKACTVHREEDPYAILNSLERVIALGPVEAFCAHRGRLRNPIPTLRRRAAWLDRTIREIERLVDDDWPDHSIAFQVLGPEGIVTRSSRGEMAKRHFVESVRGQLQPTPGSA